MVQTPTWKLISAAENAQQVLQAIVDRDGLAQGGEQRGNWMDVFDANERLKAALAA